MSYPTEAEEKAWFAWLVDHFKTLLQDELGTFELVSKPSVTTPAIYVKTRELNSNFRIKKNALGVECIIHRNIKFKTEPMIGGRILHMNFPIELVQHDLDKGLTISILKILQDKEFIIRKEPVKTPQMETPNGVALERVIIEIEVSQRVNLR